MDVSDGCVSLLPSALVPPSPLLASAFYQSSNNTGCYINNSNKLELLGLYQNINARVDKKSNNTKNNYKKQQS